MKIFVIGFWVLSLTAGSLAYGQAVPAGNTTISSTGSNPNLPPLDGILHYSMTASEIVQHGYNGSGQTTSSTGLTGNVAYTAKSETRPFSMVLAGGMLLPNGQGQGFSTYWNVGATQGLMTRHWAMSVSDSFSFLPQSPTTGLSGIPGVGDLGALPVQGPGEGPGGGVLSYSGDRIINSLSGNIERQLGPANSISGTGGWSIIHFLDPNAGLSSSGVSGSVALNHRINGRSSASVDGVYSTFSYSGAEAGPYTPGFQSKGVNLSYQRLLSRRLSMSVSGGPSWLSSSNSTLIPSRLFAAASASLSYTRGFTSASVAYTRGANAGSGVIPGAISDSVFGSVGHTYGRVWVASANGGYSHSSGLTVFALQGFLVGVNEVYNTEFGGVQLTRGFSTHYSGYASFTVQNQTGNYAIPGINAFNGTSEVFGVGITFTPRSTRLGQF